MNLVQAAVHVLQQAEEPLHVWAIAQQAIDSGLVEDAEPVLWCAMEDSMRDTIQQSEMSDLVSLGDGFYALQAWRLGEVATVEPVPGRIIVSPRALEQQHALAQGTAERRGRATGYAPYVALGISMGALAAVLTYALRRVARAQA